MRKSDPSEGNQSVSLKTLTSKRKGNSSPPAYLKAVFGLTFHRSALFSPTGTRKTVRFSESNTYQTPPSRASDDYTSSDALSQQQQIMLDQDDSLDRLSESIGRQRELSIQIGDELDSQGELLEDLDVVVDRSRSRLDGARRRLDRFSRKAKDNGTSPFCPYIPCGMFASHSHLGVSFLLLLAAC